MRLGISNGSRRLAAALFLFGAAVAPGFGQLSFTKFELMTNHEARILMTVPASTLANIDASTDLLNWSGFLTAPAGSLNYTDTLGTNEVMRFYRAAQAAAGTLTGDHISTTAGDLVIHPVYHASLVMSWNGKMIYADPAPPASFTGIAKGDLILVTHAHGDHFDTGTLTTIKAAGGMILAPQAVYNSMTATLKAATGVLPNGVTTNVMGIEIQGIPAYNSYHTKGDCCGFVLNLGGKRIFISGDTGNTTELRALTNIDIAFMCVNVPYTLTQAEAVTVIKTIRPKIVYPYHLKNQDGTFPNLNSLKTSVGADLGIEVRLRKWY